MKLCHHCPKIEGLFHLSGLSQRHGTLIRRHKLTHRALRRRAQAESQVKRNFFSYALYSPNSFLVTFPVILFILVFLLKKLGFFFKKTLIMKLSVGIFFGGFFAALGVLLFLVAFGTDYWLLATEVGRCSKVPEDAGGEKATFHHEGFFWRCWFSGSVGENNASMWNFWYTNQSPSKNCTHAYLSPFPLIRDEHNSTAYDSAIIYRGFWTVLMLLGVLTIVMASFFIICAAPFASHILYKAGGGFFIIAGVLFSLVVVMYVIWVQAMADLENYTNVKKMDCPDFAVYVRYGWSFMLAPAGVFFALLAGMLFLLVGRAIYLHSD